ncbi:helix-turn-helix domain-containing protein [Thermofilum pendens]|uniref:helix-turn-helix domain-containing protein n=1 Tax=Thermofilum pendens TaxID=2269 RepID=UPI00164F0812|nr:helix-turn-helix domain-containing protein [Thermofilum pendens]
MVRFKSSEYCVDEVTVASKYILLEKRVKDAYQVTQYLAENLRVFSEFLEGLPLIIAESYKGEKIEEDVVYSRHNVPVVSSSTANSLLRGERKYLVYVSKGGVFVKLNGKELRKARERMGLSRGALAREVGVSARTIAYYEEGLSDATLEIAAKLEEILGSEIFEAISVDSLRELTKSGRPSVGSPAKRGRNVEWLISTLRDFVGERYFFDKAPLDAGFKVSLKTTSKFAIKAGISKEEEVQDVKELSEATETPVVILNNKEEILSEKVIVVDKRRPEKLRDYLSRIMENTRDE